MTMEPRPNCPECDGEFEHEPANAVERRGFIKAVAAGGVATLAGLAPIPATPRLRADDSTTSSDKPAKAAESLIKELFAGLTDDQKKKVVLPWDSKERLRMSFNRALNKTTIGDVYSKSQRELVEKIVKSLCSGEDGYRRISRDGTWDGSKSFDNCGAHLFGEPGDGKKFAWMFTGHHLTLRCDGDSEEGAAFGGPLYYGHSPNGYSDKNVFNFQTKSVLEVFKTLTEDQQKKAVISGDDPGEHEDSVKLRPAKEAIPGIAIAELSKEQKELVEKAMRDLVAPYRKEDGDEVMQVIKATGGMEKIHLAFFQDAKPKDNERWHFWRIEGPGFVWNYRVLPHVHCYVNVTSKI